MDYVVLWNGKRYEFNNYGEAMSISFDLTYTEKVAERNTAIIICKDLWIIKLVSYYEVDGRSVWNVVQF